VLIEGGKITFVGRGRPIPAGAKILDVPRGAVAPGFIDFGAWMGLDAERTERAARAEPRGTSAVVTASPSLLARLAGADFDAARASGVTAALLAPEGGGPCGLVRLTPGRATVLRETAALKVPVRGGTAGLGALRETLSRARKYHDEWEAHERAKKEREAKASDPISGRWTGTLEGKTDFTLELKLDGAKASGTFQSAVTAGVAEPVEGSYEKEELKLSRKRDGFEVELALKLAAAHTLKGTWRTLASGKETKGTLEAKRAVEEAKAPRREDAFEPWRKVFRREIPVIAVARDLPAIEAALKALREERELDVVLAGAEDAAWAGDALAGKSAAVALAPELVLRERRGAEVNAAEALAAQGVPVAFASGGAARELPLGAAWAVRHGLDPADALRAMTATPARLLRMESRIGAIERGRDADLVVFDGDPFAPASRVKWVLIEGKIVVER
jgi:imidazolonepropionase-like amidohydrolase